MNAYNIQIHAHANCGSICVCWPRVAHKNIKNSNVSQAQLKRYPMQNRIQQLHNANLHGRNL